MAKVGELFIALSANTTALTKDLKRSTRITQKSAKDMERAFKIVGAALIALGSAAAIGLGVLIKKSIDTADQMNKMAQSVGLSTESLSGLAFAAELSDVNLEELGARLTNLNRRAKEAERGVISYRLSFDALGIELTDAQGKLRGTEDLLLDIADSFSKMEDGTRKSAIATDIFSNAGVKLIPFLNQGREGIKALTDEAERMGLVIDTKTAIAAEEFNDNLTRLGKTLTGLGNIVAATLLPVFVKLTDRFVAFVKDGDKIKETAREIAISFLAIALSLNELKTRATTTKDAVGNATDVFLEFLRAPFIGLQPTKDAWAELFNSAEITALRGELAAQQLVDAFFSLSKGVEQNAGRIKTSLNVVKAAITDLSKVTVESPVAKPPFDQNALISQKEELEFIRRALGGIPSDVQAIGGAFEAVTPKLELMKDIGQEFTDTLSFGFSNLIARGGKLSDVFKRLTSDLAAMLARLAILRIVGSIFGGLFGGGGAAATAISGGGGGGFGGFFQHGGTLRAGQVGVVGENGPELIAAGVTSNITPAGSLGNVTIINKFDLRGASPGVGAEVRRALRLAAQEMKALTKAEIAEASLRTA